MNLVKTISTEIDNLGRRVIKFLRFGKSDVQTSFNIAPFGIDSNVPKDTIAVYAKTGEDGKTVILGYINKEQLADVGETRLFSLDELNDLATFVHLTKDGEIHIGGTDKNMVRYQELETAFDELKQKFNDHIVNWNAFASVYVPGSPTIQGLPPTATTSSSSTADISPAKIDKIKTL